MARYRFRIVNVFAESPLAGNPLCVFEDGRGLDSATMQALALQFNLSETSFLLPGGTQQSSAPGEQSPSPCAQLRIFTPTFELPFAGHPLLGSAHVARSLFGTGDGLSLETQAGIIPLRASDDVLTLQANAPKWHAPGLQPEQIAAMLGIDAGDVAGGALWVDTGSEQLVIPLASAQAVERCRPNAELLARYSVGAKRQGLAYAWAHEAAGCVRARFFLAKHGGILEDPGTGSACANLGGWLIASGAELPLSLTVAQGAQVGRPCRLGLRVDQQQRIFVSGRVIELGHGEVRID